MAENQDFIENQPILNKVFNIIQKTEKASQAYLLVGDSIEYLQNIAILFSKILICPHRYEEKCSKCNICSRISKFEYGELKNITPINGIIKKEEIINIKNFFNSYSIEGKRGVYILNSADCLNQASANTLLKFLEEPDSNVVAILTTNNLDKVINTIVSRCQIIKVNNTNNKKGLEYVEKVTGLNKEEVELITDFIRKMEKDINYAKIMFKNSYSNFLNDRKKLEQMLFVMVLYYKDIINILLGEKSDFFEKNDLKVVLDNQDIKKISKKISFILENKTKLEYNVNTTLFLNNFLIGIGEIQNDRSNRN